MWRKLNANARQYVSLRANMGQHCILSAVHRNTACEERMAWINAMAFVPMSLQWFTSMVIYAGLPVDISVSLWLRKQRPRFAQGQPKGYFQTKEFDRTTETLGPMNEMWKNPNANMRKYVPLRASMCPHCSLSAVHRNTACEERMAWINAMAFAPLAQAPPKAGAKELLYSLNLIHEFTS